MTSIAADAGTPAGFGLDPWWLILVKAVAVFAFLVVLTLFAIVAERKVIARMQNRYGPNRAGKFGVLQSLADGIKLGVKEDIVPAGVDKVVFTLAPVISAIPAFVAFSIIPFGPTVSVFGHRTPLQLADLPVAVLVVLAMSSLGVYGIVLAGWASRSPYAVLGALRSSAQVISYEIAMALSFVAVFLYAGSLSTSEIVESQAGGSTFELFGLTLNTPSWYVVLLLPSFLIYVVTMFGETNRIPFDLPEGEGEIVGGFHTEYSSLKFAMFYLAEYINMATVSALSVTLFFGGWRAPWPISVWDGANSGWWPVLWFLAKLLIVLFVFVWARAALPRVRYDQLMRLGWKVLIPISLVWIVFVSALRALRNEGQGLRGWLIAGALLLGTLFVVSWVWETAAQRRHDELADFAAEQAEQARERPGEMYPIPPLDLPHYHDHRARVQVPAPGPAPAPAAPSSGPRTKPEVMDV